MHGSLGAVFLWNCIFWIGKTCILSHIQKVSQGIWCTRKFPFYPGPAPRFSFSKQPRICVLLEESRFSPLSPFCFDLNSGILSPLFCLLLYSKGISWRCYMPDGLPFPPLSLGGNVFMNWHKRTIESLWPDTDLQNDQLWKVTTTSPSHCLLLFF